jgi:hypothetical protein
MENFMENILNIMIFVKYGLNVIVKMAKDKENFLNIMEVVKLK